VPPQGVLLSLLQGYQASGEFAGLAARTRFDYIKHIRTIEKEFGDFPLKALTDRARAASSWRGAIGSPIARADKRITHGKCSRACCRGAMIADSCWQIHARAAVGYIAARAPT
jgi:hypothetical protein